MNDDDSKFLINSSKMTNQPQRGLSLNFDVDSIGDLKGSNCFSVNIIFSYVSYRAYLHGQNFPKLQKNEYTKNSKNLYTFISSR